MSLVNELRDLIRSERAISGRVVTTFNGMVRVATSTGIVEVSGGEGLQTGDVVIVQNGRAAKKCLNDDIPVFFV